MIDQPVQQAARKRFNTKARTIRGQPRVYGAKPPLLLVLALVVLGGCSLVDTVDPHPPADPQQPNGQQQPAKPLPVVEEDDTANKSPKLWYYREWNAVSKGAEAAQIRAWMDQTFGHLSNSSRPLISPVDAVEYHGVVSATNSGADWKLLGLWGVGDRTIFFSNPAFPKASDVGSFTHTNGPGIRQINTHELPYGPEPRYQASISDEGLRLMRPELSDDLVRYLTNPNFLAANYSLGPVGLALSQAKELPQTIRGLPFAFDEKLELDAQPQANAPRVWKQGSIVVEYRTKKVKATTVVMVSLVVGIQDSDIRWDSIMAFGPVAPEAAFLYDPHSVEGLSDRAAFEVNRKRAQAHAAYFLHWAQTHGIPSTPVDVQWITSPGSIPSALERIPDFPDFGKDTLAFTVHYGESIKRLLNLDRRQLNEILRNLGSDPFAAASPKLKKIWMPASAAGDSNLLAHELAHVLFTKSLGSYQGLIQNGKVDLGVLSAQAIRDEALTEALARRMMGWPVLDTAPVFPASALGNKDSDVIDRYGAFAYQIGPALVAAPSASPKDLNSATAASMFGPTSRPADAAPSLGILAWNSLLHTLPLEKQALLDLTLAYAGDEVGLAEGRLVSWKIHLKGTDAQAKGKLTEVLQSTPGFTVEGTGEAAWSVTHLPQ